MEAKVLHDHDLVFRATAGGQAFRIDTSSSPADPGAGPTPKQLLLVALAGCTAIDVASTLQKMRVPFTRLEVSAAGDVVDDHPKVFRDFTVTYEIDGEVDADRTWRAVALSRDKYCSVSAMLHKHAVIRHVVRINGVDVPEP